MNRLKTLTLASTLILCAGLVWITQTHASANSFSRLVALLVNWTAGPSLPAARSGAASVLLPDGRIVTVGGTAANPLSVVALTPGAAAWAAAPALQNARFAPGAAADAAGRITIIGGRGSNNRAMKEVISYDPNTGNSQGLRSLTAARYQFAYTTASLGTYAIGGRDDAGPLASVERLGADGRWVTLAPLPEARYGFAAASDGGDHVYTFGGITAAATATATVNRYTVSTNTWDTVSPMLAATQNSAAVLGANGFIYVVGGSNGATAQATVQIYNLATDTWTFGPALPAPVSSANVVINVPNQFGQLVVIGGVDAANNNTAAVSLSPQVDAPPASIFFNGSTLATAGVAYSASVFTTGGNPLPNYLLVSAPVGMTIDGNTSAISWTPALDQIGTQTGTVRAFNTSGSLDQSFTINVAPPAPTGLTISNITANSATVSWNPLPAEIGVTSYTLVERFCSGRGGCSFPPVTGPLSDTTVTISGLVAGGGHTYAVRATVNGVTSGLSATASFVTLQPAPPTNVVVAGLTQNTITLAWTPPANSAVPVVGYRIFEFIAGVGQIVTLDNITGTSGTVGGFLTNSTHLLYVASFDANGNQSQITGPFSVTTLSPPVVFHNPAFPKPVGGGFYAESVAAVLDGQLTLVSAEAHSTAPVNFVIGGSGLPAPTFSLVGAPAGMAIDAVTGVVTWNPVAGVTPGTYTATARGTNSEGFSDLTFSYTVYPSGSDVLSPVAVQNFAATVTNITRTSATITWPATTDNVGVTGYRVYLVTPIIVCPRTGCPPLPVVAPVATVNGVTTSVNLTTLLRNTGYSFWIEAFDAAGNTSAILPGIQRSFTTLN
ncbi:MAG: fibronectin type III domain-containing protein [Acidobacteria bacterium]|nr:fibronectin type III domain-containing protein [Acidobacteriota bacterium]MBI3425333.1 fibronectin type III domain-containing protein [Acidobacteriota bacterium]